MPAADTCRNLAGLTLDDVLANQKRGTAPTQPCQPSQRTLVDVIREDESNKKDRKTWKAFKEKLRLKRAGSDWTSSIHIPASDIPHPRKSNHRNRAHSPFRNSKTVPHAESDMSTSPMDSQQVEDLDPTSPVVRPQFTRRVSSRFEGDPTENKLKPSISRHNSNRMIARAESTRRERAVTFREPYDSDEDESSDNEEQDPREVRTLSAREAVAAQEAAEAAAAAAAEAAAAAAAEAAAAAAAADEEEEGEGDHAGGERVTMSLMDLLEETDRQMGLEGSRYTLGDDWDYYEDEDDEDEEEEGGVEYTCCVCMVRHRGSAFIPCGHTFCRLCSKELWVSKGNCPLCNNFILEILNIF